MERRAAKQKALIILLITWSFVVIGVYYVVHKPFTVSNILALARALAGLGGAGLLVALGTGIGLLALASMDLSPVERITWGPALGLGMLSLLGLGLGATGFLRPRLLWTLTVVGLAATAQTLWPALKDAWCDLTWRPQGRFQISLATYCGITTAMTLVWALVPPTAWDSLVYHLSGPKRYLASGRVTHSVDLPYLGFPQLTEMLFTWGMGMAGERAAAPIHWFYGILTILALVTAGRRWFKDGSGWTAAAVLLSARTILFLLSWPYVDLALLLYATLAFLALGRWTATDRDRWLALSGIWVGLALSTKYTALALLPALGVAILCHQISNRTSAGGVLRSTIRSAAIPVMLSLLVWSPWLVKNFLLTNNPTYPFFFNGVHWDSWRSWWYDRPGTGLAYTGPWRLLTAPWDATIWGLEGAEGYSATIGPLFLALPPLVLLVWPRMSSTQRRWLRSAASFCVVLYGFWLWGLARTALLRQTRLFLPAFGVLALMTGVAVESLRIVHLETLDLQWIVRAIVTVVLTLTLMGTSILTARAQPLHVLLGFESQEDYLLRRLGWYYPAIEYLNETLSQDSTVLFLWEPRSYHCELDCQPDALLDRWLHTTHVHGYDAESISDTWRAQGITHVLLHRSGYETILEAGFDPVASADRATLTALLHNHAVKIEDFGETYELYSLGK